MKAKRAISLFVACSMFALSVAGCSLLGGKDKEAIGETASSYIDAVVNGKLKNSKKLVADEEDYFQEQSLEGNQEELVKAVIGASEYGAENIEVKKDKGSADIVFTMPDLESIADEGYSFDEFIDAIEDIDDTVEETVEFSFVKEDDEWLIDGDSTADLFEFFESIGEDLEFGGLSETAALEFVDQFISVLADGDVATAIAMSADDADITGAADEIGIDESEALDAIGGVLSAFFTNLEYTSEVTEVNDDSIVILLNGQAPDSQPAIDEAMSDTSIMAPIYADLYYSMLFGGSNDTSYITALFGVIADAISGASMTDYSNSLSVIADDEGNLLVDSAGAVMPDFDIVNSDNMEEMMIAAFDLLLADGRITQEEYNIYVAGAQPTVDADITLNQFETGSDFFYSDYTVYPGYVEVLVRTMAYYNPGDVFEYDITINGEPYAERATFNMVDTSSDRIPLEIPYEGDAPAAGSYDITVYDQGAGATTVLAHLELVVLGDGAPADPAAPAASGDAPAFGTSMAYDNTSSDFFSFHFTDDNDNWLTGDTISTNAGAIYFYARTMAYYDEGAAVAYQIYKDGELIVDDVVVNDAPHNDTFNFVYEPDGTFEDGNYVFVVHGPDTDEVLVIAYATVVTEN